MCVLATSLTTKQGSFYPSKGSKTLVLNEAFAMVVVPEYHNSGLPSAVLVVYIRYRRRYCH